MNNKIKELAEESGVRFWHSVFENDYENFDIEMFANLIIEECADALYKSRQRYASEFILEQFGEKDV